MNKGRHRFRAQDNGPTHAAAHAFVTKRGAYGSIRAGRCLIVAALLVLGVRAGAQPAVPVAAPANAAEAASTTVQPASSATELILSGTAYCDADGKPKKRCQLGDRLDVGFRNLKEWMSATDHHVGDVQLVLNGRVMRGMPSSGPDNSYGYLSFDLKPDAEHADTSKQNHETWTALMTDVRHDGILHVSVAGGGNPPYWGPQEIVAFGVVPGYGWAILALLVALLIAFIVLARRSDIVRDSPSVNGVKQSYSLARCQMAWWFFLVAASYCYIWLILKDRDSLSPGVLVLIGISAGTGLAAGVVDAGKRQQRTMLEQEQAAMAPRLSALPVAISAAATPTEAADLRAELQQKTTRMAEINSTLAGLPSPIGPSQSFLLDILRDETGISFHRFQMVAWTIILGIVFVNSVWSSFVMPDFSATLLGLMGISAGTYVGFKLSDSPK